MQRLSSSWTFFYKRVVPIWWFGMLTMVTIGLIGQVWDGEASPLVLLIPLGMMLFGYLFFKALVLDLVDRVYLYEGTIIVRNRGEEDRFLLSNIASLYATWRMFPEQITLILHHPCKFGSSISFSPTYRWWRYGTHPIETELRKIIQEQDWQKKHEPTQTLVASK